MFAGMSVSKTSDSHGLKRTGFVWEACFVGSRSHIEHETTQIYIIESFRVVDQGRSRFTVMRAPQLPNDRPEERW